MTRYFKGHDKRNGRQMIFEVYDEPQNDFEDTVYQVVASAIEKTGRKDYVSIEDCETENFIEREISETEYYTYILIQKLLTEMFLNQYTGGFPCMSVVNKLIRELPKNVVKWGKEVEQNGDLE